MFFSDKDHKELKLTLIKLISECSEINIISPFITKNAFNSFNEEFEDLFTRGGFLKIITTNFDINSTSFNIKDLKEIKNKNPEKIEIIVQLIENNNQSPLHMKAYIFKDEHKKEAIIGSSNFTLKGLNYGEFNVKINDKLSVDKISNRFIEMLNEEEFNWKKIEELEEEDFQTNFAKKGLIIESKPNFVKNNIKLKDFQSKIIEIFREKQNQKRNHLVVLPTGTGKTIVSLFMYKEFLKKYKSARLLFVAHRREIVMNAENLYFNQGFKTKFINDKTDIFNEQENIFITTKSLSNMIDLNLFKQDDFQFIIYDEAHHTSDENESNQFNKIFTYFNSINNIALTATPERTDGLNIAEIFGLPLYDMRIHEAIEKDLVSNFNYFLIKNDNKENIISSDLKSNSILYKKLNSENRQQILLESIKNFVSNVNNKTVVFCINKEHAIETNDFLLENGYNSSLLITGIDTRKKIINDFKNGLTNFICVVDIFNEGIDIPDITNLIFLRPTKSKIVFLQQLGRGLRKLENKILNVIDIVDNIEDKNYWYSKLSCILSEKDISKLFNGQQLDSNVNFIFDKLSKKQILEKLGKNFEGQSKKHKYWMTEVYSNDEKEILKLLIVINKQTDQITQIYNFETKENLNDDFITNKVNYFSAVKEFKGLSINNLVKKFGDLENTELLIDFDNIKITQKEFIYNFLTSVLKEELKLEEGTKLYKEFNDKNRAEILVTKNGFLLLEGSYVKPFGRNLHNVSSEDKWNDDSNFRTPLDNETKLRQISKDIEFDSWNLMTEFIVGGNASAPVELSLETTKNSVNNYYKNWIIDFIGK